MANELCMNCFSKKGTESICPNCGYIEGTPPAKPYYLEPGTVLLGRYILGTVFKSDENAITYRCYDKEKGTVIAARELFPEDLVSRSPGSKAVQLIPGESEAKYKDAIQKCLKEAQFLQQFEGSEDVVNVFDSFEENGTAYVIEEPVDGMRLDEYLERKAIIQPKDALILGLKLTGAVGKLHDKGLYHGDLNPACFVLTNNNEIKLVDLGAAGGGTPASKNNTRDGYSAPELYHSSGKAGVATDVYSMGAILFRLLTGKRPVAASEREKKDRMLSPQKLGVKIGNHVDKAVMEAMAIKTELRTPTIRDFEDSLQNNREAEYPEDKVKQKNRKFYWIGAVAAVAVIAIAAVVFVLTRSGGGGGVIMEPGISGPTQITVWVENKDQQQWVEEVVSAGFKKGDIKLEGSARSWDKFFADTEKVDVTVEVHDEMEKDLAAAAERPNMFVTDHVTSAQKGDLISLKDVYDGVDSKEYAYFNDYVTAFPDFKEMPTGLDTLTLYVGSIDYYKGSALQQDTGIESISANPSASSVEIGEIVHDMTQYIEYKQPLFVGDDGYLNNQFAAFVSSAQPRAMYLTDPDDATAFFSKQTDGAPKTVKDLMSIRFFNHTVERPAFQLNGDITAPWGSQIVASASYRHQMEEALEYSVNNTYACPNPLKGYKTYVVTKDGKMLVEFSERFGVTDSGSADQKLASQKLLYALLLGPSQKRKNVYDAQMTYPIRSEELIAFKDEVRNDMSGFCDLYQQNNPYIILGSLSGEMTPFTSYLPKPTDTMNVKAYRAMLENACGEFLSASGADAGADADAEAAE